MYFTYNNISIYYNVRGEGKNLLLLHGWGADGRIFDGIINSFEKHYKVITPDIPPFGMSGEFGGDFNVSAYRDIIMALLKHLNIEKTDVICHSFGCRIALKIAAENSVIDRLIICSGAGLPYRKTLKSVCKKVEYKLYKFLAGKEIINKSRLKKFFSNDYNSLPENLTKTFVNIINEDLTAYAEQVQCPALIIWGKEDKQTPLYMARMFNNLIKGSRLCIINGGHYGFLDDFAGFMKAAENFLEVI